jgi:hypothetical protein
MIILYFLVFLYKISYISGINLIQTLEKDILTNKILRFNKTNISSFIESSAPIITLYNTNNQTINNIDKTENTITIVFSVLGGIFGYSLISITIFHILKKKKKIKRLKYIEKMKEEENKKKIAEIIKSTPDDEILVLDV